MQLNFRVCTSVAPMFRSNYHLWCLWMSRTFWLSQSQIHQSAVADVKCVQESAREGVSFSVSALYVTHIQQNEQEKSRWWKRWQMLENKLSISPLLMILYTRVCKERERENLLIAFTGNPEIVMHIYIKKKSSKSRNGGNAQNVSSGMAASSARDKALGKVLLLLLDPTTTHSCVRSAWVMLPSCHNTKDASVLLSKGTHHKFIEILHVWGFSTFPLIYLHQQESVN